MDIWWFDRLICLHVEEAVKKLYDGEYLKAVKTIDNTYMLLGTSNILQSKFPFPVSVSTLFNLLTQRAHIHLAFHHYETADSMIAMADLLINRNPLPKEMQVRYLLLKSNIPTMPNPVCHSLMILSKALKIAESLKNKYMVVEVYMEMGKFLSTEYSALGLSILRKVETYCKRNQHKEGEIGAKVYRARGSFMLATYKKYQWVKDRNRFMQETLRLIDTINPAQIKKAYNRNIYNELKQGVVDYQAYMKNNG